jgi:hypothetical protein
MQLTLNKNDKDRMTIKKKVSQKQEEFYGVYPRDT